MEAASSSVARRIQGAPSHGPLAVLVELAAAGSGPFRRALEGIAAARRRARARRDLHGLNDHFLKDIGIERSQIDRLFD